MTSADRRRDLMRSLCVGLAAALVLTLTGAFGTLERPFWPRLTYWLFMMGVGSVWGEVCARLLNRVEGLDDRPWLHVVALTAMIVGPMCLFVWIATGPIFHGRLYPLDRLGMLFVPVLTVTAAISALSVFLHREWPVETRSGPGAPERVRFLDRLPSKLRGARLIAVESEDHYLRLHTDRGSDLILMRLSDAVAELEGLEGAQTHRSWWVARDAVRGAERGDGRATLTLEGGVLAPVSRRYARALREAGWY